MEWSVISFPDDAFSVHMCEGDHSVDILVAVMAAIQDGANE